MNQHFSTIDQISKMIDECSTKSPEDSKMDLLNRVFFSSKYYH